MKINLLLETSMFILNLKDIEKILEQSFYFLSKEFMQIFFYFSLFFLSLTGLIADNFSSNPYEGVELLPYNSQGWYGNATAIEELFTKYQPEVVIEVGCWIGSSTIHMGSLLPEKGIIYAVDHWLGSEEHQPGEAYWQPVLPYLYQQFLSNIIHAQLTDKIIPLRMSSLEASQQLVNVQADFIYLDASHDFESVYADLNAWYPLVKDSGILGGDDWGHPDVCQAVEKFAQEQNMIIKTYPGTAFWQLVHSSLKVES